MPGTRHALANPGRGSYNRPVSSTRRRADDADAPMPVPVGPWRRHRRRTAYENAWIEVLHDEAARPDGSPGVYGRVHFRTRAVGIVAVGDDGRILMVGQHRY